MISPQKHHGELGQVCGRGEHLTGRPVPAQIVERGRFPIGVHSHSHLALEPRSDVEARVLHPEPVQDVVSDPLLVVGGGHSLGQHMSQQREGEVAVVTSGRKQGKEMVSVSKSLVVHVENKKIN